MTISMVGMRMACGRQRVVLLLVALVLLALAARTARAFYPAKVDKDTVQYVEMARAFVLIDPAAAFSINPRMPPLYTLLMSAGEFAGVGAFAAGVMVSVLAGTLLTVCAFFVGRSLFGVKSALLAAFVCATHPYLVRISAEALRDSLFLFLLCAGVAAALHGASRRRLWPWLVSGIFCALATATRSEGMELALAAGVFLVVCGLRGLHQVASCRAELLCGLCFAVGFAIGIMPFEYLSMIWGTQWYALDPRVFEYVHSFLGKSDMLPLD